MMKSCPHLVAQRLDVPLVRLQLGGHPRQLLLELCRCHHRLCAPITSCQWASQCFLQKAVTQALIVASRSWHRAWLMHWPLPRVCRRVRTGMMTESRQRLTSLPEAAGGAPMAICLWLHAMGRSRPRSIMQHGPGNCMVSGSQVGDAAQAINPQFPVLMR